jgi:L-cysteine desulfidase
LVNKQYCILNQQYSEEEYKTKVSDYSNMPVKDLLEQYAKLKNDCLKNILSNVNANNCFACSEVSESSGSKFCFNMIDGENISYCNDSAGNMKDSMDVSVIGA